MFMLRVVALVGPNWPTSFQKDRSNGLKVIVFSKIQVGRRRAAAIFNFFHIILKLQVIALVFLKWPTKFQKVRSNGLKVMIFSKNPRWPPACGRHLGLFENFIIAGCSPCGSEVTHQISKISVRRLKSYPVFKNPRWRTAAILFSCGRIGKRLVSLCSLTPKTLV
jgi:hypothetical protein